MNQEDELIRENDKTLIINTHNAVQALQERVDSAAFDIRIIISYLLNNLRCSAIIHLF